MPAVAPPPPELVESLSASSLRARAARSAPAVLLSGGESGAGPAFAAGLQCSCGSSPPLRLQQDSGGGGCCHCFLSEFREVILMALGALIFLYALNHSSSGAVAACSGGGTL